MRAIVSVINDLSTDQRVHKVCTSLKTMGYDVTLVGRRRKDSLAMDQRNYQTVRMFLLFETGPLFYAFFQLRLFFYLLFKKAGVLVSNDLDTLLPNFLVSRLKNIPLVYDTHEVFCEVPELQHHPFKKKIWKRIERFVFPKLENVFTVNDSIARIYSEEYKVKVNVVRNVPLKEEPAAQEIHRTREELGLPENKKIILMQGAGLNVERGVEEAVMAMNYLDDVLLLIIGCGDVIEEMKKITRESGLNDKICFLPKLPFRDLKQYTQLADLGLTLDKDTNINYRYSLPNKLFDYIHAGVPIVASDLVEIRKIVETYQVGCICSGHDPKKLAELIKESLSNTEVMKIWKENTKIAADNLCWEKEEKILKEVYTKFIVRLAFPFRKCLAEQCRRRRGRG